MAVSPGCRNPHLVPVVPVRLPVEALQDDLIAVAQRWPGCCCTTSLQSQTEPSLMPCTVQHASANSSHHTVSAGCSGTYRVRMLG